MDDKWVLLVGYMDDGELVLGFSSTQLQFCAHRIIGKIIGFPLTKNKKSIYFFYRQIGFIFISILEYGSL